MFAFKFDMEIEEVDRSSGVLNFTRVLQVHGSGFWRQRWIMV